MYTIFITGTAGSGKSLLTAVLKRWYYEKGATAATINLDPGAVSLPYEADIDVREYIDLQTVMEEYQLGPNGALIFASDLIATRLPDIQDEVDKFNPDYALFDTPGQVELFAYRASGPFMIENFRCEGRAVIFIFDPRLVSTPTNFVSIALLAASIQLRLNTPQIPVLSKRDMPDVDWRRIMKWASNIYTLREALEHEERATHYILSSGILRELVKVGFAYELIPLSAVTQEGMVELSATLSRILKGGEEVEDTP